MAEARDASAAVGFGESYELTCERLTDEHLLATPLDHAIPAQAANLMISVVPRIYQARRQSTSRWLPMCSRRRLLERLMRTLLVVVLAEAVEPPLLLGRRCSCRLRRLCLQCTVHALVTTVVLRARWRDVARLDAELQPPHRQCRAPSSARRPTESTDSVPHTLAPASS